MREKPYWEISTEERIALAKVAFSEDMKDEKYQPHPRGRCVVCGEPKKKKTRDMSCGNPDCVAILKRKRNKYGQDLE